MARNRLGTRRALRFTAGSSVRLPKVGPFSNLTAPLVSSLPNITFDCMHIDMTSSRASPITANTITISSGFSFAATNFNIWMWCNTFTFGTSFIDASGINGQDAFGGCGGATGGAGGNGGSGGGGGATNVAGGSTDGGNGGSGGNGQEGQTDVGCGYSGGPGGAGFRNSYDSGDPYVLPSGGDGEGAGGCGSGAGGAGLAGAGGGGAGGSVGSPSTGGGGGGGGGGAIVIIARQIIGATGSLIAMGAAGGAGSGCSANNGTRGGGGAVLVGAIRYDNSLTINVLSGGGCGFGTGNFRILELSRSGNTILVTHNNSGGTWNHL